MANIQFIQAVNQYKAYSLTTSNFFSSCRSQGMTRKDLENFLVENICSLSDIVKEYAFNTQKGTYKSVSSLVKTFQPSKNKAERNDVEWSISFSNSALAGYSRYLKQNGLDPKTCRALSVVEKTVESTETTETVTNIGKEAANKLAEQTKEIEELKKSALTSNEVLAGKEARIETSESILSQIKALAEKVSAKNTKAEIIATVEEIKTLVNV